MSEVKLIWSPSVFVVGRQVVDTSELGRFLESRGVDSWGTDAPSAAETLVECAGRACYASWKTPRPGGNATYVDRILGEKHGSVTEHAVFNLVFSGIDRNLSHELVRHRAGWGYSQASQRFIDCSDVAFVVPPALIDEVKEASEIGTAPHGFDRTGRAYGWDWLKSVRDSAMTYESLAEYLSYKLINRHFPQDGIHSMEEAQAWLRRHKDQATAMRKAAREAARSVLPPCAETVVFATGNVRAIRNMVEQRGSIGADAAFRRLACAVVGVMKREAPNLFADVEVLPSDDGLGRVEVKHSKV